MKGSNSDLRYYSAVLVLAFFAVPAAAGPCLLALGDCPVAALSDCHQDQGQQADPFCCEEAAVAAAKVPSAKMKAPCLLAPETAQSPLVEGAAREPATPPGGTPTPSRGSSLFVLLSSFLI